MARAGARELTASLLLSAVLVCDADWVEQEESALCARVGLAPRPLGDCPYVLVGPPERLAERVRERRERIGLDWLIVPLAEIDRFAADVMPLLAYGVTPEAPQDGRQGSWRPPERSDIPRRG